MECPWKARSGVDIMLATKTPRRSAVAGLTPASEMSWLITDLERTLTR